jgi:carboxylesterase type B
MAPSGWKPGDEKLPVLVKIHGGGYVAGRAQLEDGYSLLRHSRGGLVFVSIQYRLGVYGFLASEAVKGDGVANAGLLDQRLAMNWVSKYIEKFGGDPDKVVIDGGNAGGGSIGLHLTMFGGRNAPPFNGAIIGLFVSSCFSE